MATNPMKRRERNSFLIGFIIALLIMVVVVGIIYSLYSKKNQELNQIKEKQVEVLVASSNLESGKKVKMSDFEVATVLTTMEVGEYYTDPNEIFIESSDSSEIDYSVERELKIDIPKGTIITKKMLKEEKVLGLDTYRKKEYNSIVLPSQLKVGDYIDIRLSLPTGQDYVVLSKKEVLEVDEDTIWLNVNEEEILILNCAIVESWIITGTKLYAIQYVEAGMQKAATITYKPNAWVIDIINNNANKITVVDKNGEEKQVHLFDDEFNEKSELAENFRTYIDAELEKYTEEERAASVEAGYSEEITTIKQHRKEFIDSLNSSKNQ